MLLIKKEEYTVDDILNYIKLPDCHGWVDVMCEYCLGDIEYIESNLIYEILERWIKEPPDEFEEYEIIYHLRKLEEFKEICSDVKHYKL